MALYNGIDPVAMVSRGNYTETFVTSTGGGNIASLRVSRGMMESAPAPVEPGGKGRGQIAWLLYYLLRRK
jgi:hypothetical protein